MGDGRVEEFQKLFPGISFDAAREGLDRLAEVIAETPGSAPISERIRIFREKAREAALNGEEWAIEIGESEGWAVRVDSDFRIEGSSD